MDTNIVNKKSVTASATFDAPFMKKLRNTEAELKKRIAQKNLCIYLYWKLLQKRKQGE